MSPVYHVKLPMFEGPLDLLLHLIEERKLHINDISLATITDEYLAYLKKLQDFPLREAAQFVVIASTLVLIKSRSLLPFLTLTEEEEENIEDLERRLALLKRIRELSRAHIAARFGKRVIFFREPSRDIVLVFSPTKEITLSGIMEAIRRVISYLPTKEAIPQLIVKKMVSMEEMIQSLTERITASLEISFKDFTAKSAKEKAHIIVGFLAMLELVKRGIVSVKQDKHFEDIIIHKS